MHIKIINIILYYNVIIPQILDYKASIYHSLGDFSFPCTNWNCFSYN